MGEKSFRNFRHLDFAHQILFEFAIWDSLTFTICNTILLDNTSQQNFFCIYGETVSGVYRGR